MQPLDVCTSLWLCKSSPSGWALILSPAGGFAQTLRGDCTPQYLHHKITDLRREQGRGWESKQIFTSCKVTLSTRHRQRQNHGEQRMETICRADLPGADLPGAVLPLKAAIAAREGTGGMQGTPGWQVPPLLPTAPSLLPALAGWGSYHRGPRQSWSSSDLTVPKELLEEWQHLFVAQRLGIPLPTRWFFHSFPFLNTSGWERMSGAGGEMLLPGRKRKMSCLPWAFLGCWRMQEMQVAAGTMRIWWSEGGSCQGDVASSPQNSPHHFKYTETQSLHPWHCLGLCLLLTCTGQSDAALSGKGLIPG